MGKPVHASLWRQFSTIARRQLRLIVADRGYFCVLGVAAVHRRSAAAGRGRRRRLRQGGIGRCRAERAEADRGPAELRCDLHGNRADRSRNWSANAPIFRREQAVGLSASAYLAAKIAVFGAVAVVQSAVLVLIVTAPKIGKGAPLGRGGCWVVRRSELFVDIAATCVAAAILGLFVSALAQNSNQVLPLMVVTLMAQLVLAGGFIPVTTGLLDPVSWLTAGAVGLGRHGLDGRSDQHGGGDPDRIPIGSTPHRRGLFDIVMLGVLSVCYVGLAAVEDSTQGHDQVVVLTLRTRSG